MGRAVLVCACEPGYLCPRCVGTPEDPGYLYEPDPRAEPLDPDFLALFYGDEPA